MLFTEKAKPPRVTPGVCKDCNTQPHQCSSCNDFQCFCPNPFQYAAYQAARARGERGQKPLTRKHYGRDGQPYPAQFIDVAVDDKPINLKALIEDVYV